MAESKMVSFPVKPKESPIQWITRLRLDGVGYSHFGFDIRDKEYPWLIITVGKTPEETISVMMAAGESWRNGNMNIGCSHDKKKVEG